MTLDASMSRRLTTLRINAGVVPVDKGRAYDLDGGIAITTDLEWDYYVGIQPDIQNRADPAL